MARLYYVPIMHHDSIQNLVLTSFRQATAQKQNGISFADIMRDKLQIVDRFEAMLHDRFADFFTNFNQDPSKLNIMMDGLINGKIERGALDGYPFVKTRHINRDEALETCKQAANDGSIVHRIIFNLCSKGAHVWGTENADLIQSWMGYEHFHELEEDLAKDLIIDRDQYIASNIKYIRKSDISVLCFMGASHDVPLRLKQRGVEFELVHPITQKDIENIIPEILGKGTYFDNLPIQ